MSRTSQLNEASCEKSKYDDINEKKNTNTSLFFNSNEALRHALHKGHGHITKDQFTGRSDL